MAAQKATEAAGEGIDQESEVEAGHKAAGDVAADGAGNQADQ